MDWGIVLVCSSSKNLCFGDPVSNQALDLQGGCSPCWFPGGVDTAAEGRLVGSPLCVRKRDCKHSLYWFRLVRMQMSHSNWLCCLSLFLFPALDLEWVWFCSWSFLFPGLVFSTSSRSSSWMRALRWRRHPKSAWAYDKLWFPSRYCHSEESSEYVFHCDLLYCQ